MTFDSKKSSIHTLHYLAGLYILGNVVECDKRG